MIFSEPLLVKVLAGEKTVTRRPVKFKDTGHEIRRVPCRYVVGKTYSVQPGRGKPSVGRILVTSVRPVALGDIWTLDARREGFWGVEEFQRYWAALHGDWKPEQQVHRIEFELVES